MVCDPAPDIGRENFSRGDEGNEHADGLGIKALPF